MALVLLGGVTPAIAGTNDPAIAFYPAPTCVKPDAKPDLPQNEPRSVQGGNGMTITTNNKDIKGYNDRVAAYNTALNDYSTCMEAYVTNAQSDITAIRDRVNRAVAAGKIP